MRIRWTHAAAEDLEHIKEYSPIIILSSPDPQ